MPRQSPEKLRKDLERARRSCFEIANLRQGLRKDGAPHSRGVRYISPARKARLALAAKIEGAKLLAADKALAEAMAKIDHE